LRLPGFANKKYEANFFVEVRKESAQIYRLRDFKLDIDSQDPPRYSDHERAKRAGISRANLSQSEYDRAFAKRARSWRNPKKSSAGLPSTERPTKATHSITHAILL
jgi:hypothetical protein